MQPSSLAALMLMSGLIFGQNPGSIPAAKGDQATPPGQTEIQALVNQLGAQEFATRTEATEKLRTLGESARQELTKAASSENLEQKTRAQGLLRELEAKDQGKSGDETRSAPLRRKEESGALTERGASPFEFGVPPDPFGFPNPQEYFKAMEEFLKSQDPNSPFGHRPRSFGFPLPQTNIIIGRNGGANSVRTMVRDGVELVWSESATRGVALKVSKVDPKTGERTESESYEAPSLESFKEQYPEAYEAHRESGIFESSLNGLRTGRFPTPSPRAGPQTSSPLTRISEGGRRLGVVLAPVPSVLRAHLEIPEEALIVDTVAKDSAAERAGLRVFDILTQVNGKNATSQEAVRDAVGAAGPGSSVALRILRAGVSVDLTAEF